MGDDPKVYKKRPHRKVKSGCSTCKRRKIKCDEEKPKCSNCVRYSSECIYPSPMEILQAQRQPSVPSTTPTTSSQTPESTVEEPQPQYNELPLSDLALLHQWTISTCFGFGDGHPEDAKPWQVDLPILAHRYPFLMRGMLAISALHLARLSPDPALRSKNVQLAAYHQDLALPEYRSIINNVTADNVHALLAFSALTTVYSFAAPKESGSLFNTRPGDTGGAPEWLFLHRGLGELPQQWQIWIAAGPMKGQLHRRNVSLVDVSLNPEDYRLAELHRMLTNLPPSEQQSRNSYEDAIRWLQQAFALTFSSESQIGPKYAVLFWVEHVDQEYLENLAEKKGPSLVLLAHLCILLKRASYFWYLDGFAEHILMEMQPVIDDEHLPWIRWPLEVCGLV